MTRKDINNRKDILLLLLCSSGAAGKHGEPISGRTRLVKMLFLFRNELLDQFKKGTSLDLDNFYDFVAWDYGPFSRDVYDDLNFFILRGFVETSASTDEESLPESAAEWSEWMVRSGVDIQDNQLSEYEEESFTLTKQGADFVSPMYESLSREQRRLLAEFKTRMAKAPLRAILRYVYEKYPDAIENSKIRDQVLSDG